MSTQIKENLEQLIEGYKELFASKLSPEQLDRNVQALMDIAAGDYMDAELSIDSGSTNNVGVQVAGNTFSGSTPVQSPASLSVNGKLYPTQNLFSSTQDFVYLQTSGYIYVYFYTNENSQPLGYFAPDQSSDTISPSHNFGSGQWS